MDKLLFEVGSSADWVADHQRMWHQLVPIAGDYVTQDVVILYRYSA